MKRLKDGINKILKRAMMDKLTKFLAVFLVLGVIGLIIVYVLQQNGVIKVK